MADKKENPAPQGEDNSKIQASDSVYALPEEAREMLAEWLFAKRLKKYRQMKKLEGAEGFQQLPGVARDFHSSSPGDGRKMDETVDADAVVFEGDAGPDVAFVDRDTSEAGDIEFEGLDGVPAC